MVSAYYSQAKSNEIGLNLMLRKKKIDTICDKKTAENFGIDYMDINDFVKI